LLLQKPYFCNSTAANSGIVVAEIRVVKNASGNTAVHIPSFFFDIRDCFQAEDCIASLRLLLFPESRGFLDNDAGHSHYVELSELFAISFATPVAFSGPCTASKPSICVGAIPGRRCHRAFRFPNQRSRL